MGWPKGKKRSKTASPEAEAPPAAKPKAQAQPKAKAKAQATVQEEAHGRSCSWLVSFPHLCWCRPPRAATTASRPSKAFSQCPPHSSRPAHATSSFAGCDLLLEGDLISGFCSEKPAAAAAQARHHQDERPAPPAPVAKQNRRAAGMGNNGTYMKVYLYRAASRVVPGRLKQPAASDSELEEVEADDSVDDQNAPPESSACDLASMSNIFSLGDSTGEQPPDEQEGVQPEPVLQPKPPAKPEAKQKAKAKPRAKARAAANYTREEINQLLQHPLCALLFSPFLSTHSLCSEATSISISTSSGKR